MDKSYRFVLSVLLVFLCVITAKAQWNKNLSENLLISKSGYGTLDLVRVAKTVDDKIFISWLSWENGNGYIKLQLLDKDGRSLFQEGGIYVSKQPTPTWSTGYGFAVTEDGSVVIVNSDTRNSVWQPYAYKVSQTGEQLWGESGKPLLKKEEGMGVNPHVCITKSDNVLIGFQNTIGNQADLKIVKLGQKGDMAWGGSISLPATNGIVGMAPSGEDGVIVTYYEASTSNYLAMKYTANGEEAWAETVQIDDTGLVKTTVDPFVISDGADGIITSWRYAISQFSVAGKAQKIDAQGKKKYEGDGILLDDLSTLSLDLSGSYLYAAHAVGVDNNKTMALSQFDENGNRTWRADDVSSEVAYQYAIYGLVPVDDGIWVVYRNASVYNKATIQYSKIDVTGKVVESNVVISDADGDKGRGELAVLQDQFAVVWTDNASSVFAQNVEGISGTSITNTYIQDQEHFAVYSHPGQKAFTMQVSLPNPVKAFVSIVDLSGKRIADLGTVALNRGINEYSYTLSPLLSGIYILILRSSEGNFCGKLIID